jgi:hypothetical protein
MPIIPALERLRQEDGKLQDDLGYTALSQKNKRKKQTKNTKKPNRNTRTQREPTGWAAATKTLPGEPHHSSPQPS